jgi:hypothetical protein
LVFWCSHWVLAYSFHSSWVVWIRFHMFFFTFYFISELWDSVFHLF